MAFAVETRVGTSVLLCWSLVWSGCTAGNGAGPMSLHDRSAREPASMRIVDGQLQQVPESRTPRWGGSVRNHSAGEPSTSLMSVSKTAFQSMNDSPGPGQSNGRTNDPLGEPGASRIRPPRKVEVESEDRSIRPSTPVGTLAERTDRTVEAVEGNPLDDQPFDNRIENLGSTDPHAEEAVVLVADESGEDLSDFETRQAVLVEFGEILDLAAGRNPQVAFAHERIREAFAELEQAELLWLPSLRAGVNYHKHEGTIQTSQGQVIDTSRNSFFTGMGSRAVGGGSVGIPGVWMQFHVTDAIFQPKIADRATSARQQGAVAATNDTLLSVALAYLRLLGALQEQMIAEETLNNIMQLCDMMASFAETGLAPQADVDRARTELTLRQNHVRRSQEAVSVESSRLVRLLSGDQSFVLLPSEPTLVPIDLVSPEEPIRRLIETGLLNRPELQENRYLVSEAVQRLNREKYAPLIPSVLLGMSYGGLGGGTGSDFHNWGDRFDFDVAAWWEVRQLGFGERAIRDSARSRVEQARLQQVQMMDQVAQEVTEAHAQVRARKGQIAIAQSGVEHAINSHRRNITRIRQGEGLPIEALQSIQALDASRREYLRALLDYNESQFRLHRALGWPIQP